MVMLAPSATAPQAERPRAGPSWARLPLERAARHSPAEDATSSFSGSPGVKGTYLDEVLMMRNAAGTKYYYHANHLYSVHAITNQSGAIVEAVSSYDAYGKPTILTGAGTDATWFTGDDVVGSVSAIGNPWWWESQRVDLETSLGYFKTRYWSFEKGRFVSRSPWGYIQNRWNVYEFSWSRPTMTVEPFSTSFFLLETPTTATPFIETVRPLPNLLRHSSTYGQELRVPGSNFIGDPIPAPRITPPTGPSVPTVPTLHPPAPFTIQPPAGSRAPKTRPKAETESEPVPYAEPQPGDPVEASDPEECKRRKIRDTHCCLYELVFVCRNKQGKDRIFKRFGTTGIEVPEDQPCRVFVASKKPFTDGINYPTSWFEGVGKWDDWEYAELQMSLKCRIEIRPAEPHRIFGPCPKSTIDLSDLMK